VLGDNTAIRGSVLTRSRDGFHTLNPNGDFAAQAGTNVGEIDTTAFRLSLLHNFSDNWSANLIVDSTQDDSDPIPDTLNPETSDADNNLFTVEPAPGAVCSSFVPDNFLPIGCFTDYSSEVESEGASLKIQGELGNYTFQSLTGYRTLDDELSTRIGFPFTQQTDQDQLSQEFTLTSNLDGPFNFVAGLFFFEEDIQLDSVFIFPFEVGVETSAQAAFFQGTYGFSDSLKLTGGIRFTDETKDLTGFGPFGLSRVESRDFSNTTFNISLDNQFTENVFGYVSFSSGFKSGGWSPDCFSPIACFLPVDEEELDTIEIGLRTSLFDERLRLNATYYMNNYENLQIGATVPDIGFTRFNVNEVEIDGFELEATALLSERLTLNATFGTISAEYTDLTLQQAGGLTNNGTAEACGGVVSIACAQQLELKNAPGYKANIALVYEQPLANGRLTGTIDASFEDESFNLVANPANSLVDVPTLFNARIAYVPNESGWRFAIWGKNITDEEYSRASTGTTFLYAAEPGTYGIDIGYRF